MNNLIHAVRRVTRLATWLHALKLVNFYSYAHVEQLRKLSAGPGLRISPSVSLRFSERIDIGRGVHVGEHSSIWAGRTHGRIYIGDKALLAPGVFISASNYATVWGTPIMDQETIEADVTVGAGAWLGVRAVVLSGVTIGDGAVVAAGAVVTRSVPAGAIVGGVPATIIGWRAGHPNAPKASGSETQNVLFL